MKRICVGILAHVDAGKTTCVESMLYNAGNIRKMGRVDHQDTFLDYDQQERDRGITIYSKEANYKWNDSEIYILDTPGHVDFSSEMERVLSVLVSAATVRTVLSCRRSMHMLWVTRPEVCGCSGRPYTSTRIFRVPSSGTGSIRALPRWTRTA